MRKSTLIPSLLGWIQLCSSGTLTGFSKDPETGVELQRLCWALCWGRIFMKDEKFWRIYVTSMESMSMKRESSLEETRERRSR